LHDLSGELTDWTETAEVDSHRPKAVIFPLGHP
jgi:hypothetical protein